MRAVVTIGPGVLELGEVEVARRSDTARLRLDRAGICGTDLKILEGATGIDYPRVLGHEMVATVVDSSRGGRIPCGARVLVNPGIHCGDCYLCQRDRPHLCRRGGLLGRDLDGVFAHSVDLPERFLHLIPDGIGTDEAGLLQVLGTVVHAQRHVSMPRGDLAVVIGLGVSGLLHLQLLGRSGDRVIGISRSPWKLALARELGAYATALPEEAASLVEEASGGRGADLVVEAVGKVATVSQAIELCGWGGEVIVYGTVTDAGTIPFYQLYFKEITLHSPRAARPSDYDAAIALAAAGQVELGRLVTARYPLHQAAKAFEAAGTGEQLKVLLTR